MNKLLLCAALCVTLTACKNADAPAVERVFICEMDTTLTERHVGVKSIKWDYHSPRVYIHYVDSADYNAYMPRPGESCRIITVQ